MPYLKPGDANPDGPTPVRTTQDVINRNVAALLDGIGDEGGTVRSVNEILPTDDNPSFPKNIVLTAPDIPCMDPTGG